MIVKSLIDKEIHKFNVAIRKVENMDIHQTIMIGMGIMEVDEMM